MRGGKIIKKILIFVLVIFAIGCNKTRDIELDPKWRGIGLIASKHDKYCKNFDRNDNRRLALCAGLKSFQTVKMGREKCIFRENYRNGKVL
jgi:hypothetical protein